MTREQWNELYLKVNDMPVEELEKIILNGARKAGILWYGDKELEELVEELRKESCGAKTTSWWRAADAIEELLPFKKQVEKGMGLLDKADKLLDAIKPRWIPVTARFPETESGDTSKPVLVTDGDCVAIAEWFNFELCDPYWSYTGIGDITHWQPLPEPPKEEA